MFEERARWNNPLSVENNKSLSRKVLHKRDEEISR